MSFKNLKKSRSASIEKLVAAAEAAGGSKSGGNEKMWKATVDKAGNGYAVLRFLPAPEGEDVPWVQYWSHGFKGPQGQYYIENSLTTLGQDDPVSELNSQLWNSGVEDDKKIARAQKRKLHYVSNVYVVSDPSNPDNVGKVMMFKYGKKIYDKIMDVMQPAFEDEEAINPFDFWEGANFKLKIREVEGYRNYDKSEFDSISPLLDGDDDALEEIYGKLEPLKQFIDPAKYKSYDVLKARLNKVLGIKEVAPTKTAEQVDLDKEQSAPSVGKTEELKEPVSSDDEEDGDALSYFQALANK